MIESFDAVCYTAVFILPGFIINSVIDVLNSTKRPSEGILLLRSLLYSVIHCAIWSWMYRIIFKLEDNCADVFWFVLVISTLVMACLTGTIIGIIKQQQVVRRIFTFVNVYCPHSTPNAWDYCFACPSSSWVIVTLVDNSVIYGYFSTRSFASSDCDERDLFIEKIYSLDENNIWIENVSIEGVYIPKEQIKTIEFLKGT